MASRTRRACRLPPDERRAAIVAATLPLVLRHGAAVSTRQIAQAADVAEGTIFRVFPDKDALMRAVTTTAFDPGPARRELAAVDRDRPLHARLVAAVEILQRRLTGVFGLLDALGLTGAPRHDGGAEHCHGPGSLTDAFGSAVVELVGPDADALRVPPAELAHLLRLLAVSGTHPRIAEGAPLTAEEIVTVLLDGLRARPDPGGDRC